MVYKTRQRARLEASLEAKPPSPQDKLLSLTDEASESSSDVSGEEFSSKEREVSDREEESGDVEQSDRIPDIMTLGDCDEPVVAVPVSTEKSSMAVSESCSSQLDPGPDMTDQLYFSFDLEGVVGRRGHRGLSLSVGGGKSDPHSELMKKSVITADFEKREYAPAISQSRYTAQKMKKVRYINV